MKHRRWLGCHMYSLCEEWTIGLCMSSSCCRAIANSTYSCICLVTGSACMTPFAAHTSWKRHSRLEASAPFRAWTSNRVICWCPEPLAVNQQNFRKHSKPFPPVFLPWALKKVLPSELTCQQQCCCCLWWSHAPHALSCGQDELAYALPAPSQAFLSSFQMGIL